MERNTELLEATMQHILDHPNSHDQGRYFNSCGTPSCFAGWAIHLAGYRYTDGVRVCQISPTGDGKALAADGVFAAQLLGIDLVNAWRLFNAGNTRSMLELMVKDLVNGDDLKSAENYYEN